MPFTAGLVKGTFSGNTFINLGVFGKETVSRRVKSLFGFDSYIYYKMLKFFLWFFSTM